MDLLAPHIAVGAAEADLTGAALQAEIDRLDQDGRSAGAAAERVEAAFALIRRAPRDLGPQLLAANILERTRRREDMLDTWAGLHDRFPDCHAALRLRLRWLAREGQTEAALSLLEERFLRDAEAGLDMTRQAELYAELRDPDAVDRMFQRLIAHDPGNIRIRVLYGKALFSRGDIVAAFDVLDPLRGENLSATARDILDRNDRAILAMEAIEENSTFSAAGPPGILRTALGLFRDRDAGPSFEAGIGGISLYTGSLGPGGAERQMTQLAEILQSRSMARRNIHGVQIAGPVRVLVNNTDEAAKKDFFRAALARAGIDLTVVQDQPGINPATRQDLPPDLADLVPLLPRNARFGLEKLYPVLAEARPDVFYIWQDGAVLTGALAALLAGVPRIAISLRGLPPSMRPHLLKPEYLDMYQALAEVPGVSFSCNSSIAATAYADWTGIPRERFSVIYNAIRPHPTEGTPDDQALWSAFEAVTEDATLTLGGLFRFTANKRGLLWVDWAAELLKRHSNMRFVLVGAGVERDAAEERAHRLGIDNRILFTGNSATVGFWLDKMDILSLLSENEGLPNTLIEAQVAGIPVISTPAGGAEETMIQGRTGYLLSSATDPDFGEYAHFIDRMLTGSPGLVRMGQMATAHARAKFDIDHVLGQTIRFFGGETIDARDEAGAPNVTPFSERDPQMSIRTRVHDAYSLFAQR